MSDLQLLTKAFDFAARKHKDQRRKGPGAEPYINHPVEVAAAIARNGGNLTSIVAGVLHDTIEDTETTHAELAREFNLAVADVVQECTDDKSLPKAERKRLQAVNAPHKSPEAATVKLADAAANVRGVTNDPPVDWSLERRRLYVTWADEVVKGLRGANAGLEKEFDQARDAAAVKLGMPAFA